MSVPDHDREATRLRREWVVALARHNRRPGPTALAAAHAAYDRYFAHAERLRPDVPRWNETLPVQRGVTPGHAGRTVRGAGVNERFGAVHDE